MNHSRRWAAVIVLSALVLLAAAPLNAPVAQAAMRGDEDAVRALLMEGADVNAAQGDGMTALHWAAQRGDNGIAGMLVYAGANLEATTRIGAYTPLHVASKAGSAEVVQLLLTYGSNPDITTVTTGSSSLHLAATAGNPDVVKLLLSAGADPNSRDTEWGQTPLIFASAQNRAEAIAVLLEGGADPSITSEVLDMQQFSRRDRAADTRQRELVNAFSVGGRTCLERDKGGVEVETRCGAMVTPAQMQIAVLAARDAFLFEAISRGEGDGLNEYEQEQARRSPVDFKGGLTALLHAARQGHMEATVALLDGGADINQLSAGDGTGPLLMATINGQFDMAMLLLRRGADPNLKAGTNGVSPLWAAVNTRWQPRTRFPQPQEMGLQQTTYIELMEALLEAGADPDARIDKHPWYMVYTGCGNGNCGLMDTKGSTAFWRAAYATDIEAMELLVAHGADPDLATPTPAPRRPRGYAGPPRGRPSSVGNFFRVGGGSDSETPEEPELPDPSGLPPAKEGEPGVFPIHAASGVGYGTGFAGNAHRHAPDAWLQVVRYLVEELNADLDARDYNGYTALHHAASRGDNEMILYLVEMGADITVVSRRGQTTADMANGPVSRVSPFPATVALLERLGSKNSHNCVSC